MPFLIFGTLGLLLWLSRKAPQPGALASTTQTSGAPLVVTGRLLPPPQVAHPLALAAIRAAMSQMLGGAPQLTAGGGGGAHPGGGGHGGGGHYGGGGWGGALAAGPWGADVTDDWAVNQQVFPTTFDYAPGFGPFSTSPTDARPMVMAGKGGGGGGGHGGGGGGGHPGGGGGRGGWGRGGRGYYGGGWGGWGGGWGWGPYWDDWWGSPYQIVGPSAAYGGAPVVVNRALPAIPIGVPVVTTGAMSADTARICEWAVRAADERTLRGLINQHAAEPAVVACLSQRLAQFAPHGA